MIDWINGTLSFFDKLQLYEDYKYHKSGKTDISDAIQRFLFTHDKETKLVNAYKVYRNFFIAYWMGVEQSENPFLQLIEKLKLFEAKSGQLVSKHRDHFIHEVYVFLLGLSVYATNRRFREIFNAFLLRNGYKDAYATAYEEFFYRWGLTALFHDVAYPIELSLKQVKEYFTFLSAYPGDTNIKQILVKIPEFPEFLKVQRLQPAEKYKTEFLSKYPEWVNNEKSENINELLAQWIAKVFSLPFQQVYLAIEEKSKDISERGRVDHAYYSSVVLFKWSHSLVQRGEWNPAYLYYPILDSSSAILLHNWYKYTLINDPFNLPPLSVDIHPISFLLILCDELQEWDRPELQTNGNEIICNADIFLGEDSFKISYKVNQENIFAKLKSKEQEIKRVIDLNSLFAVGINFNIEKKEGEM